ncbi:MAG: hypothetical protein U9N48_09285 [Euryarchaeota archaeon]|nr:hypothetical protein [Euryarchaeota archaeon]
MMDKLRNVDLDVLSPYTPAIAFLIGVGVGAILYRLYLNHGLGWDWVAINTISNVLLVGTLVYINIIYFKQFLREQKERDDEERRKWDHIQAEFL